MENEQSENRRKRSRGARQRWPSVQEQLVAAKVVHGSALETLIQNHQDVEMLHPEEASDDTVGLPLWLRVYWRKRHPQEPPAGPLDYPDVLNKVYSWMLLNQDLPPDSSEWLQAEPSKPGGE
jgi:hypothetical protein